MKWLIHYMQIVLNVSNDYELFESDILLGDDYDGDYD